MIRAARRAAWILAATAVALAPAWPVPADEPQPSDQPKRQAKPPAGQTPPAAKQKAKSATPAKPAITASAPSAQAQPATPPPGSHPKLLASFSRRKGFRTSIDDYVEQVFQSHQDPCAKAAREGVPCFPVDINQEGPHFSVADALRRYRVEGGPAPNQLPTNAELQKQMPGAPLSATGGVSFDPACTVKSLIRMVSGGTNTFYLYRTWNGDVERPLLTDHKLDPNTFLHVANFRYEFLGEYTGECQAVSAWRAAERHQPVPPGKQDQRPAPHSDATTTPSSPP